MQYKKKFINDKIIEAGKAEYLDKGFRGGNISTIATNAGVPVGNLYRYFDGKSGLLDAIVKPAYTEIPRIIERLASTYGKSAVGDNSEKAFSNLTSELARVFKDYSKEIVILADKCASTRYDDFAEILIKQISALIENRFYPGANDADKLMALLITKALISSLLDILRDQDAGYSVDTAILRIMRFYFFEADKRI